MQLTLFEAVKESLPASSSGKTCRAYSIPKTTLSAAFWAHFQAQIQPCNRQEKNGQTLVLCLEKTTKQHGASLTLNISECPNAAEESLLYQVLEPSTPPKYFLSEKAKKGILTRAERRKKTLPPLLKAVLEHTDKIL